MQSDEKYPKLFFKDWPCQNASIDDPIEIWADRTTPNKQITGLLDYLNSVDKTTLNLMWADLGCGKTHTMGYIRHLCQTEYLNIYPLYTLVPNRVSSFIDQYKNIISAFNYDDIAEMSRKIIAENGEQFLLNRVLGGSDELLNIIKSIAFGSSDAKSVSKRWLSGAGFIAKSDLILIGANKTIKTSDDALHILQGLSRIVIHSKPNRRLFIMIDEFQRLHESSDKISNNVGIGLHTFYNAVPRRLSILLSFAFRKKENVDVILSSELKSRTDTRSIHLPEMNRDEVSRFVEDLFEAYRTKEKPPIKMFPLHPECIQSVINDIEARKRLICPREIIKRIDPLLEKSLLKVKDGLNPMISVQEAKEILSSITSFD